MFSPVEAFLMLGTQGWCMFSPCFLLVIVHRDGVCSLRGFLVVIVHRDGVCVFPVM